MGTKIGKNAPCPCGSGKKYKKCCMLDKVGKPSYSWMDKDGFHVVGPGTPLSPEQIEEMTREYQKQIQNSPMWSEMVKKFGEKKAKELLKECKVKIG